MINDERSHLPQVDERQGSKRIKALPLFILAVIALLSLYILARIQTAPSDNTPEAVVAPPPPEQSLLAVQNSGKLRVLTRNTLSTYFEGPTGPNGFEYELLQSFADKLDVELELYVTDQHQNILTELNTGKYDLVAANLTITEERKAEADFGWAYLETTPQIVFRKGTAKPETPNDLIQAQVVAIKNPHHLDSLQRLKQEYPELNWIEIDNDVDLLVRLLNDGDADYAVLDSVDTMTEKRLFPEIRIGFNLEPEPVPVAWAYPKNTDRSLLIAANEHLQEYRTYGRLQALKEKYYNHTEFDYYTKRAFARDMREVLPAFQPYFEEAAAKYDLEWQILAAMSYQESHWRTDAVSPTGVKGIMMLTNDTAIDLGIEDRTAPYQSIMGGAEYFKGIYDRLPDSLVNEDRLWVAIAAYNIGLGHIYDVRRLLRRQGKNPDSWQQIEQHLPLLSKPKVYETLKYGYARGNEPVIYVRNIKNYYETLIWGSATDVDPLANVDGEEVVVEVTASQIGI